MLLGLLFCVPAISMRRTCPSNLLAPGEDEIEAHGENLNHLREPFLD